jgi:CRP-like cAMP-binding protein
VPESFFARLAPASAEALCADLRISILDAGTWVFREGEPAIEAYLVRRGLMKMVKVGVDGTAVLLGLPGPGDLVGVHAVIDGIPRTAGVRTIYESEIVVVPRDRLREVIGDNPDVALTLLAELSLQLHQALEHILDLSASSATSLVIGRLVELATDETFSSIRRPEGTSMIIDLPLSQADLAAWAGVSHRSAASALGVLRRSGLVSTSRMRIEIHDLDALGTLIAAPSHPNVARAT